MMGQEARLAQLAQAAASRRYGNSSLILVPLDGAWGIYSRDFQHLVSIVQELEDGLLRAWSEKEEKRLKRSGQQALGVDPGELGI